MNQHGLVDGIEKLEPPVREHRASIAVSFDGVAVVRHHDNVAAGRPLAERGCAFLAEPGVPNLRHFVDQIDVEVDRQAEPKGELRHHARRIGLDRHVEIRAELGEIGDKLIYSLLILAIHSGDERRVLPAREMAVERPGKTERKGYARAPSDPASIGMLGPGDQTQKRRFSAPLPPSMP